MAKEEGRSGVQILNLSQLNFSQLDQLKTQLEEEVTLLTTSMAQLKLVQQKLKDSKKAVSTATSDGKIKDCEKFICDIGTGYYVEKNKEQAKAYFQRRMDFVTKNIETLQSKLVEKHHLSENIIALMQAKVRMQIAASSGPPKILSSSKT